MIARKLLPLIIFAIAFGFVEAVVVVYLRRLFGLGSSQYEIGREQVSIMLPGLVFLEPRAALAVIKDPSILTIEKFREGATVITLAAVATIAGKNLIQKIAYFLLAFGLWDIFYYVFLRLIIGWPRSLADLDIFFLLPVPWIGPVITPLIASSVLVLTAFIILKRKDNL